MLKQCITSETERCLHAMLRLCDDSWTQKKGLTGAKKTARLHVQPSGTGSVKLHREGLDHEHLRCDCLAVLIGRGLVLLERGQ